MYISFLPVLKNPHKKLHTYFSKKSHNYKTLFFESGRQCMEAGLSFINIKSGSEILMPASMCDAVIEPFYNKDIKLHLYNLDKKMSFNMDEIIDRINSKTIAIYVIHYFGIKNDLTKIRRLCDKYNLILIEDCALTGFHQNNDIYNMGDIVIHSLWKFHPISDGAILKINNKIRSNIKETRFDEKSNFFFLKRLKIYIKSIFFGRGILHKKLSFNLGKKNISKKNLRTIKKIDIFPMSSNAYKIFSKEDLNFCMKQRINNFEALNEFCFEIGLPTLYSQCERNSIPYCFPIIADDIHSLQKALRDDGIETEISINKPVMNEEFIYTNSNIFTNITDLADKVLSIPIHQNIGPKEIKYIKSILKKNLSLIKGAKLV